TWVRPIRARAAATRKSHASASSTPPPKASPLMAAMTGIFVSVIASSVVRMWRAIDAASSAERILSSSLRSPPAQKALAPVPRMTMTRARVARTALSACASSAMVRGASALRASGRSMVRVATPRSTSSLRSFMPVALAAPAWSLQAWFRHLAKVENLGEGRFRNAAAARELADRTSRADRLLRDLRALVVSEDRVERGGEHTRTRHHLRASVGRLKPVDATLCEITRCGREQRDRVQGRNPGSRDHHIQLD